jgi:hypothetical protein
VQPKVPGSMADESKAPQSPKSLEPDASGSCTVPYAADASTSFPRKSAASTLLQVPLDHELSRRYRERFGTAILVALEDLKQSILIDNAAQLSEIARYSRDEVDR